MRAAHWDARTTAVLLMVQSLVLAFLEKQALTSDELFEALDSVRKAVRSADNIDIELIESAEQICFDFLDRVASAIREQW